MSSGTTGIPTAAIWTRRDLDLECELSARNHFRLGIRPGMVIVGAHPGYLNGGQSLQQESYEHMGCLLISIGPPESIDAAERALRTIAQLPIDRWQLFPAALQRLREAAERIGYTGLPDSESIGPESQYDKISSGQECVAYLGSTCGLSAGAHVAEDYAIVEALDARGQPVPDGTRGTMVVTSLDRDNPMIRYDVEDIIRIESDPCPCGETTRRAFFEGRAKDVVNVGDAAVLPIDVGRVLAASTEYAVVRPREPQRRLRIRIELNRGGVGARSLNIELQTALNPAGERKVERFGWTFAAGDKVMQIENDYDKEVYNGDIGYIDDVSSEDSELTASFDGRTVIYGFGELDTLVPAYAATIHKSQGSEYPAVVIPVMTQHYTMLQRNLLYTGVTRGKKLIVLVGQKKAVAIAVRNVSGRRRWSKLNEWLASRTLSTPIR